MDLSQFDDITPGPWKAHTSGGTCYVCTINGNIVADVVRCAPLGRTDIEQKANARWIAALPDIIAYARHLEAENARLREALDALSPAFAAALFNADNCARAMLAEQEAGDGRS